MRSVKDMTAPAAVRRAAVCGLAVAVLAGCSSSAIKPAPLPPGPLTSRAADQIVSSDSEAILRMAASFEQAGDLNSALSLYRRAVIKLPNDPRPLVGLGNVLAQAGDSDRAMASYQRALALAPGDIDAQIGVARQLVRLKQTEQALLVIDGLLAQGVNDARLHNSHGVALDVSGKQAEAKDAYARGLELAPGDRSLMANLALSFAIDGEFRTAVNLLQDSLNDPATRARGREKLALIYALSGQVDAAETVASTALSEERISVNRPFYERLAGLTSAQRARAVFFGELPSLEELADQSADASAAAPVAPVTTDAVPAPDPVTDQVTAVRVASLAADVAGRAADQATDARSDITAAPVSNDVDQVEPARQVAARPVSPEPEPVAPEPAAEQSDAEPATAYRVQLGAFSTGDRPARGWSQLAGRFPDLLDGWTPVVQRAPRMDGGTVHRLLADGAGGFDEARALCDALTQHDVPCVVTQGTLAVEPLETVAQP